MGECSRSRAAVLIRDGLVRVNGRVRRDPEAPVELGVDAIVVGERVVRARGFVYLALNKPRGVVTTASDEKGRATVYSFLDPELPWVGPVGRLDKASEGLLLLTNDSEWAGRVLGPSSQVEKVYHVQIRTSDADAVVHRLAPGVLSGHENLRAVRVGVLRRGRSNCWVEIVLREGKNRQIRRMMEGCGVEVLRLVRVAIGGVHLGELAKGKVRELTDDERVGLGVG